MLAFVTGRHQAWPSNMIGCSRNPSMVFACLCRSLSTVSLICLNVNHTLDLRGICQAKPSYVVICLPMSKRRALANGPGPKSKAAKAIADAPDLKVPVAALLQDQVRLFDNWLFFGRTKSAKRPITYSLCVCVRLRVSYVLSSVIIVYCEGWNPQRPWEL